MTANTSENISPLWQNIWSVVAKSRTDVPNGLLEGAAVVHDGQRVGERVQGGEEEAKAHPPEK